MAPITSDEEVPEEDDDVDGEERDDRAPELGAAANSAAAPSSGRGVEGSGLVPDELGRGFLANQWCPYTSAPRLREYVRGADG